MGQNQSRPGGAQLRGEAPGSPEFSVNKHKAPRDRGGKSKNFFPPPLQRDLELLHQPTAGTGRLRTGLSRSPSPACSCSGEKKSKQHGRRRARGTEERGAGRRWGGQAPAAAGSRQPSSPSSQQENPQGPGPAKGEPPRTQLAQRLLLRRNPNRPEPLLLSIKCSVTWASWPAKGLAKTSPLTPRWSNVF